RGLVLYDLEQRREVLALPPEASDVWSLAWGPDGTRVALGGSDGGLAVWNLTEVGARLAAVGIALPRMGALSPDRMRADPEEAIVLSSFPLPHSAYRIR